MSRRRDRFERIQGRGIDSLRSRLMELIGSDLQVSTSSGMLTGRLVDVNLSTMKLSPASTPGYGGDDILVNLRDIGYIRVITPVPTPPRS